MNQHKQNDIQHLVLLLVVLSLVACSGRYSTSSACPISPHIEDPGWGHDCGR